MSRDELVRTLIAETRATQVATDALDQAVADHLGLHRTDLRAIDVLDQRWRPTAGELAAAMHLTTGAITSVLDRLERGGWATRVPDPDDRRRVLVEATEKARRVGLGFYGSHEDALASFAGYSDAQLELLLDFARLGRRWTEERVSRVQALGSRDGKGRKRLRGRGRA